LASASRGFAARGHRLILKNLIREGAQIMLTAAMLGLIEQTGLDILILTEELDDREFFASRLTRLQTYQLLGSLAETAHNLPAEVRARLSAINWDAWASLPATLVRPNEHAFRIWVAAKELTPLTVQSLIDYKRVYPELFALAP
jgi:uncharacterized protein with HEPN domain